MLGIEFLKCASRVNQITISFDFVELIFIQLVLVQLTSLSIDLLLNSVNDRSIYIFMGVMSLYNWYVIMYITSKTANSVVCFSYEQIEY